MRRVVIFLLHHRLSGDLPNSHPSWSRRGYETCNVQLLTRRRYLNSHKEKSQILRKPRQNNEILAEHDEWMNNCCPDWTCHFLTCYPFSFLFYLSPNFSCFLILPSTSSQQFGIINKILRFANCVLPLPLNNIHRFSLWWVVANFPWI